MSIFDALRGFQKGDKITLEVVPPITQDDELSLMGLERVMREYTDLPRHAALRLGEVQTGRNPSVELQVLKPCKRGLPRARAVFRGQTVAEAAHKAKLFVEAILPCEDEGV